MNIDEKLRQVVVEIVTTSEDIEYKKISWNVIRSLSSIGEIYPLEDKFFKSFELLYHNINGTPFGPMALNITLLVDILTKMADRIFGRNNRRLMRTSLSIFTKNLTDFSDELLEASEELYYPSSEDMLIDFIGRMNIVATETPTEIDGEYFEKIENFVVMMKTLLILMYVNTSNDLNIFDLDMFTYIEKEQNFEE